MSTWWPRYADVANCYRDLWDDERVSPPVKRLIDIGREQPGPEVARAYQVIRKVRRDFDRALAEVDILLAPTTAYVAPRLDQVEVDVEGGALGVNTGGTVRLTAPANLAGLPALSIPVGFASTGLPIGAQLIGPEWSEEVVCAAGVAYQNVTDHHLPRPPGY
jgi:aspartyl-tRNA(Asn)/glutamyl-tRNA(Gln) amidotransferase subunit A